MPDLSGIPAGVSAPLLIAFALLLLIERFIGVFEKIDKWRSKKKPVVSSADVENAVSEESQANVTAAETARVANVDLSLTTRKLFGYSFFGAVSVPLVNLMIVSIFVRREGMIEAYASMLLSSMVYGIVASSLIAFYLSKKYEPMRKFVLVCIASGMLVSLLIALPFNLVSMVLSLNANL